MLTEGKLKGGNGHVKETGKRKRPNCPPPSPTPNRQKSTHIVDNDSDDYIVGRPPLSR